MVAVGYTIDGYRKEFECSDGRLSCHSKDLVSLEVPEGVTFVICYNNKLSKLILPDSVTMLCCDKGVSGLEEFIDKVNIDLW